MSAWTRMVIGTIRSLSNDPQAWEASIREFEREDRRQPPLGDAVVFVGSSTFTLWKTLQQDMAPLKVMNRGFGGAKIPDVVRYFERAVLPHKPRTVVLFAGTNDISGRAPASARDVYQGFVAFMTKVRQHLPGTAVYYLAITPTLARWRHWAIASQANELIREYAAREPGVHVIDTRDRFLGNDGKPIRGLFRWDRLHPNRQGYALLAGAIRPVLQAAASR